MIKSVLLRRIFAVAIDSLYFFPGGIFFALFSNSGIIALIIMFTMFVCRDVISERSICKCAMELYIVDKNTGKPASAKQKVIRNLFIFVYSIDGAVLIFKGESIGDEVSNTVIRTYEQLY